jgi:hypothetical protein
MAGKKTFVAGEVLLAQDVNDFLMDQTVMNFASSAARASAIPTPTEGMTTYVQDRNQLETFDGAEYRGMSGLQLIKKQTIGTAVSSVTVTGAFSATYENYKIIVSGGVASTPLPIDFRCGTTTTGYMWAGSFGGVSGSGGFGDPSASSIRTGEADTNSLRSSFDVLNPFDAKYTSVLGGFGYSIGNENMRTFAGILKDTTSYTSFTIVGTGGTMTGGTIYVYGYGT